MTTEKNESSKPQPKPSTEKPLLEKGYTPAPPPPGPKGVGKGGKPK